MTEPLIRCWNVDKPLYIRYHDEEWGVPVHDDQKLFEFLVLDGFQAGLSWWLILERREMFRAAFDGFDPVKVAEYTAKDVERLLTAPGVVKNRAKISATITNAQKCALPRDGAEVAAPDHTRFQILLPWRAGRVHYHRHTFFSFPKYLQLL